MNELTASLAELSNETLGALPEGIAVPNYDRSALTPGILHIGLGNFHRGHQAWYLHRLMQHGRAFDWAIVGAGVRPYDQVQREKIVAQDCLTTLIQLDPDGVSAEVIGSMIDYVPIEEGNGPLIDMMASPAIRIVATTVTEGGYYIHPATKAFDAGHEDIMYDVAHPNSPRTAFGAIVAALKKRRESAAGPFTLQSCDNLQGNGDLMRQTVVSLAELMDADLAAWIDAECSFPNSMVDCIVPATGPGELKLAHDFGINDQVPVTHEAFRQWVIEDDFCAGRPDWDHVGATFTDRVHDYEAMKIRILNGGHQIIANAGELLSLPTISDCMTHPLVAGLFHAVANREIVGQVDPVPGMSPTDYVALISRRFSNPKIVDTTRRVAFDGSSRHTGFLLPTIAEAIDDGQSVSGLALTEALWARMCAGTREDGSEIEPNDPIWDALTAAAQAAKETPMAWVAQNGLYGDLATEPAFTEPFCHWLSKIWRDGTEAALKAYIEAD